LRASGYEAFDDARPQRVKIPGERFLAELGMTMPVISNPFDAVRVNSVRDPSIFEGVIHELSAYRG
jgi:hypothetical protein